MKIRKILFLAVSSFLLLGCVSTTPTENKETVKVFHERCYFFQLIAQTYNKADPAIKFDEAGLFAQAKRVDADCKQRQVMFSLKVPEPHTPQAISKLKDGFCSVQGPFYGAIKSGWRFSLEVEFDDKAETIVLACQ